MAYTDFSLKQVKEEFQLATSEGGRFLPSTEPIQPSSTLAQSLSRGTSWAIAVGTDKVKSEAIVAPILMELRSAIFQDEVSLFSGSDFSVDPAIGLNGVCDFLISLSPEQLEIEAPVIMVVEAKKDNLNNGVGQCIAEMVAAHRFNSTIRSPIYGIITSGINWRYLKLEGNVCTIDLSDYPVSNVSRILGDLTWMLRSYSQSI